MRATGDCLWSALLLAPLLGACGGQDLPPIDVPPGITLPSCLDGQLLGTNASGQLECRSAPTTMLKAPSCGDTQVLTADGVAATCVEKGGGDSGVNTQARITTVTQKVNDLSTRVNNFKPGGAKSLFVGTTDTPTVGKITFTGVDNGIPAATAQCNAKFAGSHMCSTYEMFDSVVDGKMLKAGSATAKAWVYMAGWSFPMGTPTANSNATSAGGPQEGTSDNCGSYTYPTADRKWTGTAVEYAKLQTGDWGLKFHAGPSSGTVGTADYIDGAPCNKKYVIACCK